MTVEERKRKLHDLNQQAIDIHNQMRKLEREEQLQGQQDCLRLVGRAFTNQDGAYLITSVPPFESMMRGEHINLHQFPCIFIPAEKVKPPVFDITLFVKGDVPEDSNEISFADFQTLMREKLDYLLKRAATAKMRQCGKRVFTIGDRDIIREE